MEFRRQPTAERGTYVTDSQINLSWTDQVGVASYRVKRTSNRGGPYTTIAANVDGTSYSDPGLTGPTTCYYVVSAVIRHLVKEGYVVIAAGGGGIPVVADDEGILRGVAAVIDKDLASAVLAREIGADLLVISTAVEKVCLNFGTPGQRALDSMSVAEARRYLAEGHFKPGSTLPKIEACIQFVTNSGGEALITCPEALPAALDGRSGTRLVP